VGSRTPSPVEEQQFDWSINRKQYKFKNSYDQQSTSIDTDFSINDFEVSEKDENPINKDSIYDSSKVCFICSFIRSILLGSYVSMEIKLFLESE
jgi:hypothetical protein